MSFLRRVLAILLLTLLSGCSLLWNEHSPTSDSDSDSELDSLRARYAIRPRASLYVRSRPIERLPEPSLEVTSEVKRHIRAYGGGPQAYFVQSALEQRDRYYPLLVEIFSDEGIPETMINLALIESGFRADARSPMGAVGMWQFVKSTARNYGLTVNLFVDERKDPILSTIAAARHLRDLYKEFGDWHLVLAAYNAGSGALKRALRSAGQRNFWHLARNGKLSRQTAQFVPKFIAASLLINSAVAERNFQLGDKKFALLNERNTKDW